MLLQLRDKNQLTLLLSKAPAIFGSTVKSGLKGRESVNA